MIACNHLNKIEIEICNSCKPEVVLQLYSKSEPTKRAC